MGTPKVINILQMTLEHAPRGMTTDTFNEQRGYGTRLLTKTVEPHWSVEQGINADESRSHAGKAAARAKLGTNETAQSLKWLPGEIEKLEARDQRYRTQFFTVDSDLKDASERLPIFTYLWTRFDQLDQGGRIKQFATAAEQDQLVPMAAMLEHPLGPMVDAEFKERALTERAKRLFPKDYENFEQTQLLLEFLVMARDVIARWLALEVGVEIPVIAANLGDEVAEVLKHQELALK